MHHYFSLPCKGRLPTGLRCASRAGRFNMNCLVLWSLFFRSPTFIMPIQHAWLRHLPEQGRRGHPTKEKTNLASCFAARYYTGKPVNQLWPSTPNLTGHKPELFTPVSLWPANLMLPNTVDLSLTHTTGWGFDMEERWEWTHYQQQS